MTSRKNRCILITINAILYMVMTMIDKTLIDKYVEESSLNMNEKSQRHIKVLLTRFFSLKPDVAYSDLTRQNLIEMLSALNATSINVFNSEKSKVGDFMKWMLEEGHGTDQPFKNLKDITFFDVDRCHLYDRYYFKDYNDLNQTVDKAFSDRGSEFDTFRSAITLVWFGIEIKSLPDILKEDVHEDEGYVVHPTTKGKITLPPLAMHFVVQYRDADHYDSNKFGGSVMAYANSKYLFRSYKNAHFTVSQITNISSSANRVSETIGKTFQWNKIYLNGLYSRIYEHEQEHGSLAKTDFDRLKVLFDMPDIEATQQNRAKLIRMFEVYREFKEYMFS